MTTKSEAEAKGGTNAVEPAPQNVLHTYEDGTQVVGTPPFPAKSPKERAQVAEQAPTLIQPRQGQKTSGVEPASIQSGVTVEQIKAKAEQQLTSDVLSGKDPHTVNPTTSSDKPVLAGEDNVIRGDMLEPSPTGVSEKDLERIAGQIKPDGNLKATDEEKEAAAVQIAREMKGTVPTKTASKK